MNKTPLYYHNEQECIVDQDGNEIDGVVDMHAISSHKGKGQVLPVVVAKVTLMLESYPPPADEATVQDAVSTLEDILKSPD